MWSVMIACYRACNAVWVEWIAVIVTCELLKTTVQHRGTYCAGVDCQSVTVVVVLEWN